MPHFLSLSLSLKRVYKTESMKKEVILLIDAVHYFNDPWVGRA